MDRALLSIDGMRGYSLLEVLVAVTLVAVAVAALAQLFALSTHAIRRAQQATMAAVLAQQKIEELLPDTAVLTASPADALGHDVDGYSDLVDRAGRSLGAGTTPAAEAAYVRRWSVDPLPDSVNTWIVQVQVTDLRSRAVAHLVGATARRAF